MRVPPLRERVEDIRLIARHLLAQLSADVGRGKLEFDQDAERACVVLVAGQYVASSATCSSAGRYGAESRKMSRREINVDSTLAGDTSATLVDLEKKHSERVLNQERGHVEGVAGRLGIPRSSLYQKIKAHGIVVPRI